MQSKPDTPTIGMLTITGNHLSSFFGNIILVKFARRLYHSVGEEAYIKCQRFQQRLCLVVCTAMCHLLSNLNIVYMAYSRTTPMSRFEF